MGRNFPFLIDDVAPHYTEIRVVEVVCDRIEERVTNVANGGPIYIG